MTNLIMFRDTVLYFPVVVADGHSQHMLQALIDSTRLLFKILPFKEAGTQLLQFDQSSGENTPWTKSNQTFGQRKANMCQQTVKTSPADWRTPHSYNYPVCVCRAN